MCYCAHVNGFAISIKRREEEISDQSPGLKLRVVANRDESPISINHIIIIQKSIVEIPLL